MSSITHPRITFSEADTDDVDAAEVDLTVTSGRTNGTVADTGRDHYFDTFDTFEQDYYANENPFLTCRTTARDSDGFTMKHRSVSDTNQFEMRLAPARLQLDTSTMPRSISTTSISPQRPRRKSWLRRHLRSPFATLTAPFTTLLPMCARQIDAVLSVSPARPLPNAVKPPHELLRRAMTADDPTTPPPSRAADRERRAASAHVVDTDKSDAVVMSTAHSLSFSPTLRLHKFHHHPIRCIGPNADQTVSNAAGASRFNTSHPRSAGRRRAHFRAW